MPQTHCDLLSLDAQFRSATIEPWGARWRVVEDWTDGGQFITFWRKRLFAEQYVGLLEKRCH